MRKFSWLKPALLALAGGVLPLGTALGQTIYGLQTDNTLVSFPAASPGTVSTVGVISGVTAGQTLVGMDFRPATGELFALGYDQPTSTARLYTLNLVTAVATPVGPGDFTLALGAESAANIGVDFNPTVDRIRVVSADINADFRLNQITGTVAATDGSLAYAPGDPNVGRNPNVGAVAYTNSYLGATSTTLYDVDLVPNTPVGNTTVILATQNPPNAGILNTVSSDPGQPAQLVDLDIDVYTTLSTGAQTGYAVARYDIAPGASVNLLGTINLATGAIVNTGPVGPGPTPTPVVDIAVLIDRTLPAVTGNIAWALQTTQNAFVTFDTDNPTFIRSLRPITGITEPQIAGFESRPATGELFAMGYDAGTEAARLYNVNPMTGVATAIGAGPVVLTGLGAGPIVFDFNPTVDRIRVESVSGKNFRLNPNDGAIAATDGDLAYAVGDIRFGTVPTIGSGAYTNSFGGSSSTVLYTIDEALNQLNNQTPANAGTQNTVGPLGLLLDPADRTNDLDIRYQPGVITANFAFLTANVVGGGGFDNLYTVNLTSGMASLVGRIGGGIAVRDFAIRLPRALVWTGAVSVEWNEAGNWLPMEVPQELSNVTIPGEVPNNPTLLGSGVANMLTIANGGVLTLGSTSDLTLNSNIVNNGTLAGDFSSSTLFVKPSLQTISGTGATTFGNLRVINAAGAALDMAGSGASVQRVLTLDGNLTTNGRPFTLRSNPNGSAMVVNSGGMVNGAVTVERYITSTAPGIAGLGYRHLSAPVSNTTVGDLATTGFTPVVNPAYNAPANPINVRPYPNVFGFDETRFPASGNFQQGYFSPAALNSPMVPGRGYSVYMPGTSKPDFVGELGNGDVVVSNLTRTNNNGKSGWHLLGNPYPAPLDWDLVTVPAGMDPTVYVLRTTGGANGVYATRTNGVGAPGSDLIGIGQGFFAVVTSNAGTSFTFTNAARVTSYANPAVYRTAPDARPTAHLTLRRANQPAVEASDAAYIYFQEGATGAVERGIDGVKLRAEGEVASIFSLAGGQELAINGLSATAASAATVPLGVVLPLAGTYELTAAALTAFAPGTDLVLLDRRTNTTYDLTKQPTVRFTAQQPGADLTRFSLRFGRGAAATAASTLSLDVYPNPVGRTTDLRVTALGIGQGATADVALYDALGRAVLRQTVAVTAETASAVLNTRTLRPGAYTLRLTTTGGAPITRQVVVE